MLNLRGLRGRHLFALDLVVIVLAIYGAMVLRFDSLRLSHQAGDYFPAALFPLVVRPPINIVAGLYARAWAYASIGELTRIIATVLIGTIAGAVLFYGLLVPIGFPGSTSSAGGFPRSFFVLESLLTLVGIGGSRFLVRAAGDRRRSQSSGADRSLAKFPTSAARIATLVYGAGAAGATVLRTIAESRDGLGMAVVGLIDDDPAKRRQILRGARVLGSIDELRTIAGITAARRLLIAIPAASGEVIRTAVESATQLGLETRTVPALEDLVSGRLNATTIREVRVEDLLRREPVVMDDTALRGLVNGQTLLVTGAGGSIGSELARQVFDLDPARLILLDRAEGPLYDIERELSLLGSRDSGTATRDGHRRAELVTRLANVASLVSVTQIMTEDRPVLVLHAAAYKHVPMMEMHPADAVYTNVGGTLSALRAAMEAGAEHFVLVSTDKAVKPSSVMGATKRLAELAVMAAAVLSGRRYVVVRFGNVLGSSGSVVPLFQRQLAEGVPLTITHPEMTRYFMTIPEASRLILEAASIGTPGDLFVLDMGEPVRIVDLARDLARLAGRDPDSVPIEFIGLRPGEKLHETLFYEAERHEPTRHPKVMRANRSVLATSVAELAANVLARLDALVAIGAAGDHERARAELFTVLRDLDPEAVVQ